VSSAETLPREPGFSKDADKLIRRLSLVAFLLSRPGRPVSAAEIRRRVEGYALMTDDAFKRRFYEDRAELAALGVGIVSEEADGETELYSLPPSAYYLPAIQFTPDELSALAACLFVLEHRFAYSEPLRLALLSLTHSRPELLDAAAAAPVSVLPARETRRATAALPKLQQAVVAGKTVTFRYYSIGRDEELERTVDPYGLLLVGEEWYLIAWCHLRQAIRTFRLSRLRSRVTFATRAPHDFSPPPRFSIDDYLDRAPWQLGEAVGEALVLVSGDMAWWVEAHYAKAGTIEPAGDLGAGGTTAGGTTAGGTTAGGTTAGGIVFSTPYNSPAHLVSWVLSMGEAAELLEPPELRAELGAQLRRLGERLGHPPLTAAEAERLLARGDAADAGNGGAERRRVGPTGRGNERRPPRGAGPADWQVEVDRFTRLSTLMTYLRGVCHAAGDADETPVPVVEVCAALDVTPAELTADVRLLNLVNFGGEGTLLWAELKGDKLVVTCDVASSAFARPARLSPLQVDTLLLAIEILGGQLPIERGAALRGATAKLRAARRSAPSAVVAATDPLSAAERLLDAIDTAISEHRLLKIEYWSQGTGETTRRTVEPCLLVRTRGEWYYVAWCRTVQGTRTFRVATTKRAEVLDERFAPRPAVEVELYRREGIRRSEQYAPGRALVWYSRSVARYVAERDPVTPLPGGAGLAVQPYLDERWLTHELLRLGGEALPLSPPSAVRALDATVARLLTRYGDA